MMIKFTFKLLIPALMLFTSSAFANIIVTDFTDNDYITYQGIDWTWASPLNVSLLYTNELKAPEFHSGWRYASQDELDILRFELTLADFTRTDGSLTSNMPAEWNFETFYVRDTVSTQPVTVPEPTTLLIFSVGLLGFSSLRQRMSK